jgi:hypothetical protein
LNTRKRGVHAENQRPGIRFFYPAFVHREAATTLARREVRVGDRIVIPLESAAQWRVEAEPLRMFAQRYLCG